MKLLLVEDHDDSRIILGILLSRQGYDVQTASTGEEALALAAKQPFDLVIMDHGLPGANGCEIMERIRAIRPVKGIALTAAAYPLDRARSQKAGFLAHLTKPAKISVLCETIEWVAREPVG